MKNLLSKTLLCGVLATSFLIINCQKAPDRPVKAAGAPENGKLSSVPPKTGKCGPGEVTSYDAAMEAAGKVQESAKKIEDKKPADRTPEELNALKALFEDFKTKSAAAKAAINALKVGNDAADACKLEDADKSKERTLLVSDLTKELVRLAPIMENLTGAPALTPEETPKPEETPASEAADTSLKSTDQVEVSEDLAGLLSEKDSGCISSGNLIAKDNCDKLKADASVTVCFASGDGKAVEKEAKGSVIVGAMKSGELSINLNLDAADGDRPMEIKCKLAAGTTDAKAAQVATNALGEMLKKIEAKPEEKTEPAPTPAPSSTTAEELDRLQNAVSPK